MDENNGWRDIESAPRDGTWLLLLSSDSIQDSTAPRPFIHIARWVQETREYWDRVSDRRQELITKDESHWSDWEDPTHWRLLPIPPEQESA